MATAGGGLFQDGPTTVVSFHSESRNVTQQRREVPIQTDDLFVGDASVSTRLDCVDEEVQVDAVEESRTSADAMVSIADLTAFLRRVAPLIEDQLEDNLTSDAFEGYDVAWEDEIDTISCILTLKPELPPQPPEDEGGVGDALAPARLGAASAALSSAAAATAGAGAGGAPRLHSTAISWNSNGSMVACAYGNYNHRGWCVHRGALCAWNTRKPSGTTVGKPDVLVEMSSCLMCIAYHPKAPSLIAGGTFTGAVLVWDLSNRTDPRTWRTPNEDWAHREFVSAVQWTYDFREGYRIVSASGDGKVLVWSLKNNLERPVAGFKLPVSALPRPMFGAPMDRTNASALLGVSAIGISPSEQSTFVVGTETGALLKGSTFKFVSAGGDSALQESQLPNPTTFVFEPCVGPVNSVACHPTHRNVAAACAADGNLRLLNLLQSRPVAVLVPGPDALLSVDWSPARPAVLATGGTDGRVYIYDLARSPGVPVAVLEVASKATVTAVQFCPAKGEALLATADTTGEVKIWQLSHLLARPTPQDAAAVEAMGAVRADQGAAD